MPATSVSVTSPSNAPPPSSPPCLQPLSSAPRPPHSSAAPAPPYPSSPSPFSTAPPPPLALDATAYPHLLDLVFINAPFASLLALRSASRALRDRSDAILSYHILVFADGRVASRLAPRLRLPLLPFPSRAPSPAPEVAAPSSRRSNLTAFLAAHGLSTPTSEPASARSSRDPCSTPASRGDAIVLANVAEIVREAIRVVDIQAPHFDWAELRDVMHWDDVTCPCGSPMRAPAQWAESTSPRGAGDSQGNEDGDGGDGEEPVLHFGGDGFQPISTPGQASPFVSTFGPSSSFGQPSFLSSSFGLAPTPPPPLPAHLAPLRGLDLSRATVRRWGPHECWVPHGARSLEHLGSAYTQRTSGTEWYIFSPGLPSRAKLIRQEGEGGAREVFALAGEGVRHILDAIRHPRAGRDGETSSTSTYGGSATGEEEALGVDPAEAPDFHDPSWDSDSDSEDEEDTGLVDRCAIVMADFWLAIPSEAHHTWILVDAETWPSWADGKHLPLTVEAGLRAGIRRRLSHAGWGREKIDAVEGRLRFASALEYVEAVGEEVVRLEGDDHGFIFAPA